MKRWPPAVLLAFLLVAGTAYAQQATPEDFGVPPQQQQQPQQQPAPATTPAPPGSGGITVISGNTAPPPPHPTAKPETEEEKLHDFKPAFKFQLGYQYSQLHSVPINGGRGRFGVGAQNDVQAHYFTFSSMVGATETDRRVWDLRVGYEGELRLVSILRIGIGFETGYVFVRRASIDERMWALGIGAQAHVGVDAVTWGFRDDHALYVEARIEGHIHFGNAGMWGPTVSVGIRF